jgi:glycosyltransferase involved in cell wall biosynthesis
VRIALDATYTIGDQLTGIGVYSARLIDHLASNYPSDQFYLCYRAKQLLKSTFPRLPNERRRLLQPPFPILGANLFHALNQRVDRRPAKRVIATFHDLFVITSEYSSPEFRSRFTAQARSAAAHSDLIIAVSEFTSLQIQHLLGVEQSRIRVVPHGVHLPASPDEGERENIILFVGALQTRKNLMRLVSAFEAVPNNWRLILAGSPEGYGADAILDAIEGSPVRGRIEIPGHLPTSALHELFRRASIFAFPSLDEGFGMPVLEAMAFGVPVITSNGSALPEVAGDAAHFVDPSNIEDISAALIHLIQDESYRRELVRRGYRRALEFSWKNTAEKTYAIYRELL